MTNDVNVYEIFMLLKSKGYIYFTGIMNEKEMKPYPDCLLDGKIVYRKEHNKEGTKVLFNFSAQPNGKGDLLGLEMGDTQTIVSIVMPNKKTAIVRVPNFKLYEYLKEQTLPSKPKNSK